MMQDSFPEISDDMTAFPEARLVKFQYLSDYYDAKDAIENYNRTGKSLYLRKLKTALVGLYAQLRTEYKSTDLKNKTLELLEKMMVNTRFVPKYNDLLDSFFILQYKLKSMKILDIKFPEADISRDFRRSY